MIWQRRERCAPKALRAQSSKAIFPAARTFLSAALCRSAFSPLLVPPLLASSSASSSSRRLPRLGGAGSGPLRAPLRPLSPRTDELPLSGEPPRVLAPPLRAPCWPPSSKSPSSSSDPLQNAIAAASRAPRDPSCSCAPAPASALERFRALADAGDWAGSAEAGLGAEAEAETEAGAEAWLRSTTEAEAGGAAAGGG